MPPQFHDTFVLLRKNLLHPNQKNSCPARIYKTKTEALITKAELIISNSEILPINQNTGNQIQSSCNQNQKSSRQIRMHGIRFRKCSIKISEVPSRPEHMESASYFNYFYIKSAAPESACTRSTGTQGKYLQTKKGSAYLDDTRSPRVPLAYAWRSFPPYCFISLSAPFIFTPVPTISAKSLIP